MSRQRLSLLLLASLATACGGSPEEPSSDSELATREDAVNW